jgi:hypothetical protein
MYIILLMILLSEKPLMNRFEPEISSSLALKGKQTIAPLMTTPSLFFPKLKKTEIHFSLSSLHK